MLCLNLCPPVPSQEGSALAYEFARYLKVRGAWGASWSPDGLKVTFLTEITGVPQVWAAASEAACSGGTLAVSQAATSGGTCVATDNTRAAATESTKKNPTNV